jgi:hypothetical protein
LVLATEPQDIWRLPTVEEAVASLALHGAPAGGVWDVVAGRATYRITPDKESPLWNPYSRIIYWWTGTDAGAGDAYRIVYNGQVYATPKTARWGYLAFRAVRAVSDADLKREDR